jgi:hypothetical protein
MNDLPDLDLSSLKDLYEKELELLNECLLDGATWAEVEDKRKKLKELATWIQQKQKGSNPAESRR